MMISTTTTTTTGAMSSRRTEPGIVRAFCAGRDLLGRYPQSLLGLAFRFAIAVVFWRSGMTKIASWDVTLNLFQYEYAVPLLPPEIAAYMAAAAELSCPVLLVFGLGTRFAAAALLGMTAVIQIFVYPASWPDHLLWGSILVYLLTRGGGLLSLDHLVSHRFMRTADQRR